jgi:hypothetical protein
MMSILKIKDAATGNWVGVLGPTGPQGKPGENGNGIASTTLNNDYTLTIRFTNGESYTTSSIRGEAGARGPQGN